jgi:flagellar basal body rod protein FlgG
MDASLYSVMSAAKQYSQLHEVNTNNVANANTSGFKQDKVSFKALYLNGGDALSTSAFTELNHTNVDITAGALSYTSNGSDIAISGEGFFQLTDKEGNTYYRRSITVMKSNEGTLINSDGGRVNGIDGKPLNVGNSPFKVDPAGNLIMNIGGATQVAGTLNVVELEPRSVFKLPNGHISVDVETPPKPAKHFAVAQGYSEASNVNSVKAMADMMNTQKNYDMSIKTMKTLKGVHAQSNSILE